jgi:uncharacterized protein (DUF2252 family)
MTTLDPHALARRQLEIDHQHTAGSPALLGRKLARMALSPLAFLRGAAPLFYEILAAAPELAAGPGGEGWVVGDLHLENFGAYRPGDAKKGDPALFDLNDFDDCFVGPWRLDVLRLTTSLILGGRELGAAGPEVLDLSERLLKSYVRAVFARAPLPPVPRCVASLIERVEGRERKDFLDERTELSKGRRRLRRSDHYLDLTPPIRAGLEAALTEYARGLPADEVPRPEQLEVLDAAFRVAGTGSLGAVRVAALVRGKGGDDGVWLLDLKQQGTPSAAALFPPPALEPAVRVETGLRSMIESLPKMVGTTHLNGISMLVRRLSPQEDKLDLTRLKHEALGELVEHLGGLLGRGHLRGARQIPGEAWTEAEQAQLIDQAITLSGLHEGVYLALCRLMKRP